MTLVKGHVTRKSMKANEAMFVEASCDTARCIGRKQATQGTGACCLFYKRSHLRKQHISTSKLKMGHYFYIYAPYNHRFYLVSLKFRSHIPAWEMEWHAEVWPSKPGESYNEICRKQIIKTIKLVGAGGWTKMQFSSIQATYRLVTFLNESRSLSIF